MKRGVRREAARWYAHLKAASRERREVDELTPPEGLRRARGLSLFSPEESRADVYAGRVSPTPTPPRQAGQAGTRQPKATAAALAASERSADGRQTEGEATAREDQCGPRPDGGPETAKSFRMKTMR